jgi:hypothetical protein
LKALVVAVVAGALVVPAAASAPPQLPVGESDGVRIVRERGAIVVVFTKSANRLLRQVAGRRVSVYCSEFIEDGLNSGGATYRVPRRGRRLRTGDLTRGLDYCRVWREPYAVRRKGRRGQTTRKLMVSIPLTQRGALYLDEEKKTYEMMRVLLAAGLLAERRGTTEALTYDELLSALLKGVPGPRRLGLVPMAGPAETPPAGKVGYWSDGAQHVAVATLSSLGRRLFIEGEGDVLHTNVADYIYGDLE